MELSLYLDVRKSYNVIRQRMASSSRIIFDEFATLCMLSDGQSYTASDLANAQGISCPTMTHRGNRLNDLGYMSRSAAKDDRRRLDCRLTKRGLSLVEKTIALMLTVVPHGSGIAQMNSSELMALIIRAGAIPLQADSLSLCSIKESASTPMSVSGIVCRTAMLQPTVSMAVSRLEAAGLLERIGQDMVSAGPHGGLCLTKSGNQQADTLIERIGAL